VYAVETLVRAVTAIFTVPLPPPAEEQAGMVRCRYVATSDASEFNPYKKALVVFQLVTPNGSNVL